MEMTTVSISVPKGMEPYLNETDQEHSFERDAMMLYPFIHNLTISQGRAAEILGVHKSDLIDYYCSMEIPYLNQSISDLEEELDNIRSFEESRSKAK